MPIHISAAFDSGNIEVVDASDPNDIQLKIRPDPFCKGDNVTHFQWFHFRVTGARDVSLTLNIVNAGKASFPEAWPGYRACISENAKDWMRVPAEWKEKEGVITIRATPRFNSCYVAYFAPYPLQRHAEQLSALQEKPSVHLEVLGQSLDGRDIDLVRIGEPGRDKRVVWMTARQHPGESMAEWFMEGLLETLTDEHNGFSIRALHHAVFYAVPNINPDGSFRGHLRTNACGANLNREWAQPTLERSPEVLLVRDKMDETGVDLYIDVHGDEEIPFNFLAGEEGIPSYGSRLRKLSEVFTAAFQRASPDFQAKPGYEVDQPGQANMTIASNAVGERYKCLSYTLEMPFKDTSDYTDTVHGWSPQRAKHFGASILGPIYEILPLLR